jgi:acyl carrier protein
MSSLPRLIQVFREVFDDDTLVVKDETTAQDVPGWDSLTHVSLIVAVESEFGVRFSSGEINGLKNVGELRRLVEQKLG